MTYTVVQPQKNGKYYLYEVDAVWDPEKKQSRQKRTYIGACDKDGNLISKSKKNQTIQCSPVFGPYHLFAQLAEESGLRSALESVYGEEDGRRLLAMAILGVVSPCTVNQMEGEIEDTYLREVLGVEWSFEQSEVCRFLQTVGHDTGRREELFEKLAPKSGCVVFDIVCLGTDSEGLEYAEVGRKTRLTGSRQVNLGMIHSMGDGLPFCYRTYPGSVADVATIDNIVSDLASMGCSPVELEMDRGFFSAGNVALMIQCHSGFTVPVPARNGILKELISESVGQIDSPLNSDYLAGGVVRGYETHVMLVDDEFVRASADDDGAIRAVVFQDDVRRTKEVNMLYSRITDLESRLAGTEYDRFLRRKLSKRDAETAEMLEFSEGPDGKTVIGRKRKSITAKENKCGRFAVITTSELPWQELLIQYRMRNGVEYDFSQLQSDLFVGLCGKSDQDSAEGGLLVNFLSLRLRITLIERMKKSPLAGKMWVPDVISLLKKLKMSCVGGNWRLNEVTKSQRELFKQLGIRLP
ncbi:IS1634 family transposase [Methanomethylophilus alvi]|uniref:IS1634 family transposase n=1 Tax=Methanomethylophilus alvi TaxID=1291540 RepID=UPI0037DDACA3